MECPYIITMSSLIARDSVKMRYATRKEARSVFAMIRRECQREGSPLTLTLSIERAGQPVKVLEVY